jgi:hypothetical protein
LVVPASAERYIWMWSAVTVSIGVAVTRVTRAPLVPAVKASTALVGDVPKVVLAVVSAAKPVFGVCGVTMELAVTVMSRGLWLRRTQLGSRPSPG